MAGLQLLNGATPLKIFTDSQGLFSLPPDLATPQLALAMGGNRFQAWFCGVLCTMRNILLGNFQDFLTVHLVDTVSGSSLPGLVERSTSAAERDTLYHIDRIRRSVSRFIRAPWLNRPVVAVVNSKEEACDAVFEKGALKFFDAGTVQLANGPARCRNAGTIADIIYHEWGHGFYQSLLGTSYAVEDPAASEATADILAFHMTKDSRIGLGFFETADPARNFVRDIGSRRTDGKPRSYPADVPRSGDPHDEGMILSGAMWDLHQALVARYGLERGNVSSLRLFLRAIALEQTYTNFYPSLLAADDDDSNLLNGTPHKAEIKRAFAARCLATEDNAPYCS
jgi:hypothetical protein